MLDGLRISEPVDWVVFDGPPRGQADATQSIEQQQQQMRAIVMREIGEHLATEILRTPVGGAHAL